MSMLNTNSNKFSIPTTVGQSGHLRNNKSISIGNGANEPSSHRKKASNQHSRNNSQKITANEKDFFSQQQSYMSLNKPIYRQATRNHEQYASKGIGGSTFNVLTDQQRIMQKLQLNVALQQSNQKAKAS